VNPPEAIIPARVVTTQEAMMDGEEEATKFAKGPKREAKLLFKGESCRQCNFSVDRLKIDRLKEKTCAIITALQSSD
jgi:hypothetical protein